MKRREFTKYLGLGSVASLLPASVQKIFGKTEEAPLILKTENPIIPATVNVLSSQDLNQRVVQWLKDPALYKGFSFLSKTPIVDCSDEDVMMPSGKCFVADMISSDSEATVYETGEYEFVTSSTPKYKVGQTLSEGSARRLLNPNKNTEFIENWKKTLSYNLARGLLQRMNSITCGMYCGRLIHNKLGLKASFDWDIPENLKLDISLNQTDFKLKLIRKLKAVRKVAFGTYGKNYDHMILSSTAFEQLSGSGKVTKSALAKIRRVLKLKTIELNDEFFWERLNTGVLSKVRVLPQDHIILSSTVDHNNPNAADFANCVTAESIMVALLKQHGVVSVELDEILYGPIAYFTGNQDLNPPNCTAWAIFRGIPRRHDSALSAVLKINGLPIKDSDPDEEPSKGDFAL